MAARRVVLIDDNDDQRAMLANALRSHGWRVEGARTGKLGVEAVARIQPEIVLTELLLPDVRGFNFARTLRSMVEHDLFVIALTRLPEELHGRALTSGFDRVQRKPVDVDVLHERMLAMTLPVTRAS